MPAPSAAPPVRQDWSSRLAFLLAAIGAAIGLGNLWRFPYIAGQNGGGAFVLVYLGFVLVISIPLVMAELGMGRRGHHSPVNTMRQLCAEAGAHPAWQAIGWLSILAPLAALCFYSVVAGWALDYVISAVRGRFAGIDGPGAAAVFGELMASPGRMFFWYSLYLAATVFVVCRGVRRGIQSANLLMTPALFVMLLVLVGYAHVAGDAAAAWRFMFTPDFSALTATGVLLALGQALFSVSVATGALITYGAYLSREVRIPGSSWTIALVDTAAALLAGLAIFPIVFASGLDPADGPGLMFVSLPLALGQMPGGVFFSVVFFVLVFFAAFTSSLAMLEPFVSYMEEHRGFRRVPVTVCTGIGVWLVGTTAVLSFNVLRDFTPLSFIPLYEGRNLFAVIDFTVSGVLLPLNALLIALFAGWVFRRTLREEIGLRPEWNYRLWSLMVRWLAPIAVGAVMVFSFLG
jgi:NSS family neurotransmitter:Na+ symporter